eukprot:2563874-Rhodomonas_salina.1
MVLWQGDGLGLLGQRREAYKLAVLSDSEFIYYLAIIRFVALVPPYPVLYNGGWCWLAQMTCLIKEEKTAPGTELARFFFWTKAAGAHVLPFKEQLAAVIDLGLKVEERPGVISRRYYRAQFC